jgi:hypothetical protein
MFKDLIIAVYFFVTKRLHKKNIRLQRLNLVCLWAVELKDSLCRFFKKKCRLKPTNLLEKKEELCTVNH